MLLPALRLFETLFVACVLALLVLLASLVSLLGVAVRR
jgi:hypothetical protein